MKEQDNISFEAISLETLNAFRATLDLKDWMRVKVADLSLRDEDTRYSEDGILRFKTTYTDHNGANRTFNYKPGIDLGLPKSDNGLYDLQGIYVNVMWSPKLNWFLVLINLPDHGALAYRGLTEPHSAKRPNGMSVRINRTGVTA
ncbi:hypothetical protein pEaSNUABM37_00213 [Erwinia phage pEa_SNUABM_37]|nr:hypothetical protein pEaSNUABM37_00213 [Erwinia phage pEa_SNUABM_37]QXO10683.1 hypothetical protein pEaSNUABM48_00213 [Erwinia phage pEa_SNUABM_48]